LSSDFRTEQNLHIVTMPLEMSKNERRRQSGFVVNKKLNFSEDRVCKPFPLNFSDARNSSSQISDSESDSADSVIENSEDESDDLDFQPLEHFGTRLSPIRKECASNLAQHSSPVSFIRRRERTSTQIIPNKRITHPSHKKANINAYSPAARRCSKRQHSSSSFSSSSSDCDSDDSGRWSPLSEKKLRVSELSISRYEAEFLELSEVASGEFGSVKLARHRLDGSDYAVKVNKTKLRPGSYEEKKALNEVFAHATLNSDNHVVRYYNSWVEEGQVFIQNEFCQGGSLSQKIEEKRSSCETFSEEELKKIFRHMLKGLQYIHSKQMAHLDIKPENIFISIDENVSVGDSDDTVYKIGDLGHVASLYGGDLTPEEGDCRYMAPELLLMDVNCSQLHKADIFSLGLSLYEAASLKNLPKNSFDDPEYEKIRNGNLPYLNQYSREFNSLISSMVNPDPLLRPSSSKLVKTPLLDTSKSMELIKKDLRDTQEKLQYLLNILGQDAPK